MTDQQETYFLGHLAVFASKEDIKKWFHTAPPEQLMEEAKLTRIAIESIS